MAMVRNITIQYETRSARCGELSVMVVKGRRQMRATLSDICSALAVMVCAYTKVMVRCCLTFLLVVE
jgi:hypothetical protein